MPRASVRQSVDRLLVMLPTWLGDVVMATPTLQALRQFYPDAHITALCTRPTRDALAPCPWVDRILTTRSPRSGAGQRGRGRGLGLARRLAAGGFDTAVLLPNSFRSALVARLAGIPRRVGYDRDGRGSLLTDRLVPMRSGGRYTPISAVEYYLGLARYLGAEVTTSNPRLCTWPGADEAVRAMLRDAGWRDPAGQPMVVVAPGASFGPSKLWLPERFAEVADTCVSRHGAFVALSGSADERPILDAVQAAATEDLVDLPRLGVGLRRLKSAIAMADLVISNDTGARHLAAGLGTAVVSLFGPTDPRWAQLGFDRERQIRVDVPCAPCQQKVCPLKGTVEDHQCMRRISAAMVLDPVDELLAGRRAVARTAPALG